MRFRVISGVSVSVALLAAGLAGAPASGAAQPVDVPVEPLAAPHKDNLPNALAEGQAALKKDAIARVVNGTATPELRNGSEVVRVGGNRWAELKKKADKVDPIFVVLADFGNQVDSRFGGTVGPIHNQIPEPNRAVDNSTAWKADYTTDHYMEVYNGPGESVADMYSKMSGGKYSVNAQVSDWVTLPFNEARYGSNNADDKEVYWPYVRDSANAWYDSQVAAGKTPQQITEYLKQFDVWDRYDFDNDGNFNEPDGYIDHFQTVHAGEGEEAGGGAQGPDAIWSHRWYAFGDLLGKAGPAGNFLGGTQIGTSGIWIGDYTVQPENGGLGVFAHEFGHDLGLPDMYDTAGGDNGTGFWDLMGAGSWLSDSTIDIGTRPVYMGAWEKLFLGWLDYEIVRDGRTQHIALGSAARPEGPLPQAVAVSLPSQHVVRDYNDPHSGSAEWWGGSKDQINYSLVRDIDLTSATTASISAWAWYEIEEGFDYLYAEASLDGVMWEHVGEPITGEKPQWSQLTYDLSAYAGKNVKFRFRYQTDGGVHLAGPFLDDITVTVNGSPAFSDNVESGDNGWAAIGFSRMNGVHEFDAERFYLAEFRSYTGYDSSLRTGPYNFGFTNAKPDWVEKFPYQDGLLIWYVNNAFEDNNTRVHPGFGQALPFDARPAPIAWPNCSVPPTTGNPAGLCMLGNRRQPFDATFGTQATDAVTFHRLSVPASVASQPAIRVFDDSDVNRYYSAQNPWSSVKTAGNGVKIEVVLELARGPLPVMLVKVTN
ncbi:MAG TPA: immune inhibitor A domain-containing protein [Candidatus Limnocylindrales bacterium]